MKVKALLIGGSVDGKIIDVNDDEDKIPVLAAHRRRVDEPHDPNEMAWTEIYTYRTRFVEWEEAVHIFAIRNMTTEEAIGTLLTTYCTAAKRKRLTANFLNKT